MTYNYKCKSCGYEISSAPPNTLDRGFVSIFRAELCNDCKEVVQVLKDLDRSSVRYKPEFEEKCKFLICPRCEGTNLNKWEGKCPKCGKGMKKVNTDKIWD
ncbi:MAG: hypothetical protein PHS44_03440 [Candidatus Dojkabacteria bacterium]|nr:hypothetical protein [Candidatus Dojkabacteria bacterium]